MRQLIVASRLGRTEYQLLLMKISWWDRNVKIRYKFLVVIDEFLTVCLLLSIPISLFFPNHHHHHNRFMALFLGPRGWAGARREILDFMVQRKINRGRHTDYPAERHSIRTNQCPPPPSPHIFIGRMPFLPPNQQRKSTEGNIFYFSLTACVKVLTHFFWTQGLFFTSKLVHECRASLYAYLSFSFSCFQRKR